MADDKDEKKVTPEPKAAKAVKPVAPTKAAAPKADKAEKAAPAAKAEAKEKATKTVAAKTATKTATPAKTATKSAAKPATAEAASKSAAKAPAKAGRKPAAKAAAGSDGGDPLSVKVFSMKGEESGSLQLPGSVFGEKPNEAVMHQAIRRQLANARQGTAATKKRDDVSGGGRKPFRQKGLGRSRHGSEREPSMVGGGVVFGPQPRSFRLEMPRKMRRLALRSALSVKVAEGQVSIIDSFSMEKPHTRTMVDLLESVGVEGTALVVLAAPNDAIARSTANLPWAKTILAHNLNLYDLFTHDHIVLAQDAVELIEETFSR